MARRGENIYKRKDNRWDEHLKGIEHFTAVPALDLSYHVYAVGQVDGFGIAELVAGEDISLGGFSGFIAACTLEIDFKHGTDFGCFDLSGAVIGMLDDGDLALDDVLVHVEVCGVQLHGIEFCIGIGIVHGGIKQITLTGTDLTDRPFHVLVARIVVGNEIAVFVGGIGVDERTVLIHAVHCTFEGSIALCLVDSFAVELLCFCFPFLEDVVELDLGYLIPFNNRPLAFGYHITNSGIHFLHGVILTDEDIFEYCHTVLVSIGVNADLLAGE